MNFMYDLIIGGGTVGDVGVPTPTLFQVWGLEYVSTPPLFGKDFYFIFANEQSSI